MDSQFGPAGGQEQEPAFAGALHSLLVTVHHMCHHHGVDRSAAALCDGLPDGLALTPATALQALRSAGLVASLVECGFDSLSMLPLPVILLRLDRRACMLMAIDDADTAAPAYVVMLPEMERGTVTLNAPVLLADYAGFAILARPQAACADAVASGAGAAKAHWLSLILWAGVVIGILCWCQVRLARMGRPALESRGAQ
ncbi:hypothetical protein [Herbaspirillum sp. alder98]|uniref:hypothetical protein n=1 Tax=Herbaspirillum sp. alder98 TaxID=2913096 RepID=UPI001CD894BB|nr:hypothetical protein [Herbaspirillum sp. alder98]MCA1325964.1 hypothetical protein [Herbaspirillum sp. alder98]